MEEVSVSMVDDDVRTHYATFFNVNQRIEIPANVDGVSFLSQMRGEKGESRQWVYIWYSPRQRLDLTVSEYVFNSNYKLYRDGRFFDWKSDPQELKALNADSLNQEETAAREALQMALDQFTDARPAELDRQFESLMKSQPADAVR